MMLKFIALALWVYSGLICAQVRKEGDLLSPLFQDHGVLQRDRPIRVWGSTQPGRKVQVDLGAMRVRTRAGKTGRWEVLLPSLPAGGPHSLSVSDGLRVQSANDLLVGDVWLCSGQSNMELPVWRALDAGSELDKPSAPTIRLLTVPQVASAVALDSLARTPQWQEVDADTLRDFSATCFFFGRELQKTIDVPMGLINASWSGSRIEAWIDADQLRRDRRFVETLDVLSLYGKDPQAAAKRWGEVWGKWWQQRNGTVPGDQPWNSSSASTVAWRQAPDQLGPWEHWNDPALADFNGMVWFRTRVGLTAEQAGQGAVLELGALDETDITWVNGQAVGSEYAPGSPRRYTLPSGLLREGENSIVINVLDTYREGGMSAPASAYRLVFLDGSSASLDHWQYRVADEGPSPPNAPWQSAGGVSTLYNGMIAPLGPYGLRGALWYQGESNTGEPEAYGPLLEHLRAGWRARFGKDLPLLIVQLAGYGAAPTRPGESGWAGVREAQRRVAEADRHTGLAIALDLGDRYDIHPPNKQEVGRRLARAARHVVFGAALEPSGPAAVSASREGNSIVVHFKDASKGLVAYGAEGPIGFELCGEAVGTCRYVSARIRGEQVVLRALPTGQATRVRYGWADNPVITLFDREGLPAGPFELAIDP